jgi:hypothetical protein
MEDFSMMRSALYLSIGVSSLAILKSITKPNTLSRKTTNQTIKSESEKEAA